MGIGLYLHIPFCRQKCNYCDFNSGPFRDADLDLYADLIQQEASLYESCYGKLAVDTIFIGGGTPTVLQPKHILKIGEALKLHFDLSSLIEFSFEANPESVTFEKAEAFKQIGANRVSIGLQTANDDELFAISRIHDWQTFLDAYRVLRQAEFTNINIDLMIGLPGQTHTSYMRSLEKVLMLEPEHISNYGLILEDGTPLAAQLETGTVSVLDGTSEREVYHSAYALLKEKGYQLYEISNFAKDGKHCLHNENYWRCGAYAALGVGAHGYLNGERYENAETLTDYSASLKQGVLPIIHRETIDQSEQEREYVMLALRMAEGIIKEDYETRFGKNPLELYKPVIEKYIVTKHLQYTQSGFALTLEGMDISNTIIVDCFDCLDTILF